jgi:hypothetical protein
VIKARFGVTMAPIEAFDDPARAEAIEGLRSVDHGTGSTNLGLTNGTAGLDIEDDRVRSIDQIVGGIGEEGRPAQRACPLGCRI